jgi:hypothetical protein
VQSWWSALERSELGFHKMKRTDMLVLLVNCGNPEDGAKQGVDAQAMCSTFDHFGTGAPQLDWTVARPGGFSLHEWELKVLKRLAGQLYSFAKHRPDAADYALPALQRLTLSNSLQQSRGAVVQLLVKADYLGMEAGALAALQACVAATLRMPDKEAKTKEPDWIIGHSVNRLPTYDGHMEHPWVASIVPRAPTRPEHLLGKTLVHTGPKTHLFMNVGPAITAFGNTPAWRKCSAARLKMAAPGSAGSQCAIHMI